MSTTFGGVLRGEAGFEGDEGGVDMLFLKMANCRVLTCNLQPG